jgi:PAS domain S-box-containing protein
VSKISSLAAPPDLIVRTLWYIYIRWFVLLAIALPGIISLFIVDGFSKQLERDIILGLFALSTNALFYVASRLFKTEKQFKILAIILIGFDIFIITGLIFINGGIESRNVLLYVLPILLAAAIFGRRAIYKTTTATIVAYDCVILFDYFNIINTVGAFDPSLHSWFAYVVNTVVFFSAVLIIIGIIVDFITRLLAEKEREVRDHLDALKQAQSIANFGSWEFDIKNNKIFWSEEISNIFTLKNPNGELGVEHFIKLLHPDDRALAQSTIEQAIKKQKPYNFEYRIIRPGGGINYLYGKGHPVVDEHGEVVKLVGWAQDITKARLLEEARNDFVALASHQLRTPATGVKQYLSLLIEGYAGSLSPDQSKFARIAYEANDRQLDIVEDLLNVAQVDSGNLKIRKEKTELVRVIESIVKDEALKFENKQQVLSFTTPYKNLYIDVDKRRLRMVIENILDNAHKYTKEGGHVKISLKKQAKNIYITISDDGIGIASKDIANVFRKFARINNPAIKPSEGTGLGLYIAKRIIKLHGGKIVIESTPNIGTKFKIYLPMKSSVKK